MEPITTTIIATAAAPYIYNQVGVILSETVLGSVALNIISNKIDKYGAKQYKKFIERIDKPTNHDIQKAVRRSYLKALLLAVEHEKKLDSFMSKILSLDNKAESYIKKQIKDLEKQNAAFPSTDFDEQYQHLFRTQKETPEATIQVMTDMLKDTVLNELRDQGINVSERLESYIKQGWEEEVKPKARKVSYLKIDWYKLVCAFFTEELKTNDRLSNVIQTEYLDNIAQDIQGWKKHLEILHLEYEELIDICNQILEIVTETNIKVTENIEVSKDTNQKVTELPVDIRNIFREELQKHPSIENMKVDEYYQQLQKEIKNFIKEEETTKSEIEDLKAELADETDPKRQERKKRMLNRAEISFIKINGQKIEKEKELETFIKEVISLAKYLDTNDIDTQRFKKAKDFFAVGRYKEAGDVLNEKDIYQDIKQTKEKLGDYVQELILKAKITVINKETADWYEQADRLYKNAIDTFESYDSLSAYARFLYDHMQYLQAIPFYEKCALLASNEEEKANILSNLGVILYKTDCLKEAEESFIEAVGIYRELAELNPQIYLSYVVGTLNNLGVLYENTNRSERAMESYLEVLRIYEKLEELNSETNLVNLAQMYNNLGHSLKNCNLLEAAERSYKNALGIDRELAELNPLGVVLSLTSIGNLQLITDRLKEAEESYAEALWIAIKLTESNPHTYLADVAMIFNNLGVLFKDTDRPKKAVKSYTEALGIYRKLAELNPQAYLSYVALTLDNLGGIQVITDLPKEAEDNYKEALRIKKKLANSNPQQHLIKYADTALNLAILYINQIPDKAKSIFFAREAENAYAPFAKKVPYAIEKKKTAEDILQYWEEQ